MIAQVISALAILITLHELGHFVAARMFGIKVEKFYLFFDAWGIKLFKFKKGDTEYGIGWLPLGGYVKIAGMIDESLDKDQLNKDPEPWEFRSKPAWQRLIVMVGGVFVNLVLGIFIYSMSLYYYGDSYLPMRVINDNGGVVVSDLGKNFGFQTGDKILLVNGEEFKKPESFFKSDILLADKVEVTVDRNGDIIQLIMPENMADKLSESKNIAPFYARIKVVVDSVLPETIAAKAGLLKGDLLVNILYDTLSLPAAYQDELSVALNTLKNKKVAIEVLRNEQIIPIEVQLDSTGVLGFNIADTYKDLREKTYFGFFQSFSEGTTRSFGLILANAKGIGQIVSGKIKATNALQGPVAIAGLFGKVWDWQRFWNLTAILSLILAFMNLLPIPALDGGHVVFLLIEMIIGKPVNEKIMHAAQLVGMILLLALMVFVIGNDIFRAFK